MIIKYDKEAQAISIPVSDVPGIVAHTKELVAGVVMVDYLASGEVYALEILNVDGIEDYRGVGNMTDKMTPELRDKVQLLEITLCFALMALRDGKITSDEMDLYRDYVTDSILSLLQPEIDKAVHIANLKWMGKLIDAGIPIMDDPDDVPDDLYNQAYVDNARKQAAEETLSRHDLYVRKVNTLNNPYGVTGIPNTTYKYVPLVEALQDNPPDYHNLCGKER